MEELERLFGELDDDLNDLVDANNSNTHRLNGLVLLLISKGVFSAEELAESINVSEDNIKPSARNGRAR